MCGRYVLESSPEELAARFAVDDVRVVDAAPDYNVAPQAEVMVIRERDDRRVLSRVRWGLVPTWAKDPSSGARMVNVRSESLLDRPTFRTTLAKRRCLVPADGFYEWAAPVRRGPGRPVKQPYFAHRRDGAPLALAGLWEVWRIPPDHPLARLDAQSTEHGWLRTCTILTMPARGALAAVHERMPVTVPEEGWGQWLDPGEGDPAGLVALLDLDRDADVLDAELEVHAVSTSVNRAEHNGPELIEPVVADAVTLDLGAP